MLNRCVIIRLLSLVILSALLFIGCSRELQYRLVFPSKEAFFVSAKAEVDLYKVDEKSSNIFCANLLSGADLTSERVASTEIKDTCAFYDGLILQTIPSGLTVFHAQLHAKNGDVVLEGCRIVDSALLADQNIEIALSITDKYPENVNVTCVEPSDKCSNGKVCVD